MRPQPHAAAFLSAVTQASPTLVPGEPMLIVPLPAQTHPPLGATLSLIIPPRDLTLVRFHAVEGVLAPLLMHHSDMVRIASQLLFELVRLGYLENGSVPESRIDGVVLAMERGIHLKDQLREFDAGIARRIIGVVSLDIVRVLFPLVVEESAVALAFSTLRTRVDLTREPLSENARDVALLLAVWRGLFAGDDLLLYARLFPLYLPAWTTANTRAQVGEIAERFLEVDVALREMLEQTLPERLLPSVIDILIGAAVLYDLSVSAPSGEVAQYVENTDLLDTSVRGLLARRYEEIRERAQDAAMHAAKYLAYVGAGLLVFLELPYAVGMKHELRMVGNMLSVILPPIWLLFVAGRIGMPNVLNTNRIASLVHDMVFGDPRPGSLRRPLARTLPIASLWLAILLLLATTFIFSLIVVVSHMHEVASAVFAVLLTLSTVIGLRIRFVADRLTLSALRPEFSERVVRYLLTPFVLIGRVIARHVDRTHTMLVILDSLLLLSQERIVRLLLDLLLFARRGNEHA